MNKGDTTKITYEVRLDMETRDRWLIARAGDLTGQFGNTIHAAVEAAIDLAKLEEKSPGVRVRVVLTVGDERHQQYP